MEKQEAVLAVLFLVLCLYPKAVVADEAVVGGAIIGVLLMWFGVPLFLSIIGFGKTIAAHSLASTLMSLTSRIGSGSGLVALLQSIGSAGVSWTTVIVGGLLGASLGYFIGQRRLKQTAANEERENVEANKDM